MALTASHYKQKTEKFLLTRPPTCYKPDSCFWFVRRDKKGLKRICYSICRNCKYSYFHVKTPLKLQVKPLLHSVFQLIT